MNLTERREFIRELYDRYNARDYFGDNLVIDNLKERRDAADSATVLRMTDEQIENHVRGKTLDFLHKRYREIDTALIAEDLDWLTKTLRYTEHVSLEMFEAITGLKAKGLSNKKLRPVFEKAIAEKPRKLAMEVLEGREIWSVNWEGLVVVKGGQFHVYLDFHGGGGPDKVIENPTDEQIKILSDELFEAEFGYWPGSPQYHRELEKEFGPIGKGE